jgi:hypothetical protein
MASFTFLQISDLHLGRPFTWLPPAIAERRRADQRDMLFRAIKLATERKLGAVLIVGDLFDGEVVDKETIGRAIECVSQDGCPPVFIAPGNHDCFSRSTFYYDNRRLVAAGQAPWPAHVHIFDAPKIAAATVAGRSDVTVWGRCVHENVDSSERILKDDKPALDEGRLHILMLHGSRDGFLPPGKKVTAPFNDAELLAWGADYAALGHYHKAGRITDDEGVIRGSYAGSPIALASDETGPRFVELVTIEHNGLHRRVEIETIELDPRRLHRIEVEVRGVGSPEGLAARIAEALETSIVSRDDRRSPTARRPPPGVDLRPQGGQETGRYFWLRVDDGALRADRAWRVSPKRGAPHRRALSPLLLEEMGATSDPERKRVLEAALYYGLDALRMGDVAPRYEFPAEEGGVPAGVPASPAPADRPAGNSR